MTKNDFIYALKTSGCLYHNGQTYYEENELIRTFEDMEMFEEDKALSQEPCIDAVSRKDVLDLLSLYINDTTMIEEDVKQLPSVNPQPCDDAISLTKEAYSDLCLRASKADDLQRALDMEKGAYNALVKNIQCDDAISINAVDRFGVLNEIYEWTISGEYEQPRGTDILIKRINNMPTVTQESEYFIDGVHAMGYREGYKDAQKQKSGKWDRLYSWLNDMRLGIAPDETVTDIDERHCRESQTDILDEIMEWMIKAEVEPQESEEQTE